MKNNITEILTKHSLSVTCTQGYLAIWTMRQIIMKSFGKQWATLPSL